LKNISSAFFPRFFNSSDGNFECLKLNLDFRKLNFYLDILAHLTDFAKILIYQSGKKRINLKILALFDFHQKVSNSVCETSATLTQNTSVLPRPVLPRVQLGAQCQEDENLGLLFIVSNSYLKSVQPMKQ